LLLSEKKKNKEKKIPKILSKGGKKRKEEKGGKPQPLKKGQKKKGEPYS